MKLLQIKIKVKEARTERNVTLKDLSEHTGISKGHLSAVERMVKTPSIIIMCKIAKSLNCKLDDLVDY